MATFLAFWVALAGAGEPRWVAPGDLSEPPVATDPEPPPTWRRQPVVAYPEGLRADPPAACRVRAAFDEAGAFVDATPIDCPKPFFRAAATGLSGALVVPTNPDGIATKSSYVLDFQFTLSTPPPPTTGPLAPEPPGDAADPAVRTFQPEELRWRLGPRPVYPDALLALELPPANCRVRVDFDETGAVTGVSALSCPAGFFPATVAALSAARLYATKVDGVAVPGNVELNLVYTLRSLP